MMPTRDVIAVIEQAREAERLRVELDDIALRVPRAEAAAVLAHLEHDALGYSDRGILVGQFFDRLRTALKGATR